MVTLFIFLIVLLIVVLVHELGHFLATRRFKVKVEEFGFGLPPRALVLFKGKETLYTLNYLPIGGFVRLYGETDETGRLQQAKRAFVTQPWWVKLIILSAGVVANFVLASLLFGAYYFTKGVPTPSDEAVTITYVVPGSPAQTAGVKEGDKIELIYTDSQHLIIPKKPTDVAEFVSPLVGQPVKFKLRRPLGYNKSRLIEVSIVPIEREGRGIVGVMLASLEVRFYPWYKQIPVGIWYGFQESLGWVSSISSSLRHIVVQIFSTGQVPEGVAGPVGIYQVTAQAANLGAASLIRFIGLLSVNLAVINLLPLPALDGGRIVFVFINQFLPFKRVRQAEHWVHLVGMAVLLALMALITFSDIAKLLR